MYKKKFLCDHCGADFVISHDLYDPVDFCPFCGGDLYDDEEEYEPEEE